TMAPLSWRRRTVASPRPDAPPATSAPLPAMFIHAPYFPKVGRRLAGDPRGRARQAIAESDSTADRCGVRGVQRVEDQLRHDRVERQRAVLGEVVRADV